MKTRNLVTVRLQDSSRRKARILLTVLGVTVDCCSVVIMTSTGIGTKDAQEKTLAQMEDLSIVQVYPTRRGTKSAKLNTRAINKIKELRGMETVTPRLGEESVPITVYGGRDRWHKAGYASIVEIDLSAARAMGYKFTQGDWQPDKRDCIYAEQNFAYMFEDTKRPWGKNTVDMYGGEWDNKGVPVMPLLCFGIMKTPVTIELDSGREDGKRVAQAFKAARRLKEDFAKGEGTSMGLLINLEMCQLFLEQQARLAGKKWDSRKGYQSVLVKVRDIRDVAQAESEIKKMGFRISSMKSIRKSMEQKVKQKQMMLESLGAIFLFAAALGVANTMIMSIPERTREIDVMKSLGCFVEDVRKIFLLEAGCVSLLEDITGSVLSYGISAAMNLAAARLPVSVSMQIIDGMADIPSHLFVIPWRLSLFIILFLVAIGVGAGYYPASKMMRVSALEAIRHD